MNYKEKYNNMYDYLIELLNNRDFNIKHNMNTKKFKAPIKNCVSSLKDSLYYLKLESKNCNSIIYLKDKTIKNGIVFYNV